jgi:hypothetical protein
MNTASRTEVPGQTDQVQERHPHPSVAIWPGEVCFSDPDRYENPARPDIPDAAFQTFADGAGI